MLHPVLLRQLRRLGFGPDRPPTDPTGWTALLGRIDKAYHDADNDRYTLERSTAISSHEMQQLYESLRANDAVLQQERDRLHAVIAAIGDGLCVLEPDGRPRFANAAALHLLGIDGAMLAAFPVLECLRATVDGAVLPASPDAEIRCDDGLLRRSDGGQLPVSYVLTPIRAGTEAIGTVLVFRDISRSKQEQATLRQSLELAESANRAKSEFLAVMSHELRTPISGVIGLTHLLLDLQLPADARDYAEAIAQSGRSLLAVISDILDLSKIEAGRLVLEHAPFRLFEPIEQALDVVALPAQEKGVDVTAVLAPDLPEFVHGDATRLRQVLLNLLGNAVKFTERGDVLLRAEVAARGPDQIEVRIQVSDTGIGIPPEAHDRLFSPFHQVDSSTTRKYGGTGLGLAISRRLARSMGGDLGCTSEPGVGSTFTCTVPLSLTVDTDDAAPAPLHGMRVLLVSSSANTVASIDALCQACGAGVTAVSTAAAARALLIQQTATADTFHAVLADRILADGDGLEFLARLAHDPLADSIVRVCMATWPQRPSNAELEHSEVHRLLRKPVRRDDLVRALCTLVGAGDETEPAPRRQRVRTGARVLIAEDNPIGQRVAQHMLQKRGYDTVVVADGKSAIAACSAGAFDLVFMDCQMPVCDGFAAAQAIRTLPGRIRQVPIVALTANALEGDRERCLAAGMDDYLPKPLTPSTLDAMLERWLQAE